MGWHRVDKLDALLAGSENPEWHFRWLRRPGWRYRQLLYLKTRIRKTRNITTALTTVVDPVIRDYIVAMFERESVQLQLNGIPSQAFLHKKTQCYQEAELVRHCCSGPSGGFYRWIVEAALMCRDVTIEEISDHLGFLEGGPLTLKLYSDLYFDVREILGSPYRLLNMLYAERDDTSELSLLNMDLAWKLVAYQFGLETLLELAKTQLGFPAPRILQEWVQDQNNTQMLFYSQDLVRQLRTSYHPSPDMVLSNVMKLNGTDPRSMVGSTGGGQEMAEFMDDLAKSYTLTLQTLDAPPVVREPRVLLPVSADTVD
jgi:hypothetical protein